MRITSLLVILALAEPILADPRVAIIAEGLPGQEPAITQAILRSLEPITPKPESIPPDALGNPEILKGIDLLVVPSARSLPASFAPAIEAHLSSGGRVIACGLPLGSLRVIRAGDKWITRDEYDRVAASVKAEKILLRFDEREVKSLSRSTNSEKDDVIESEAGALHVRIPELIGWDTLNCVIDHPFAAGQVLTCFRARGSEATRQLALEWEETDGSRWIATVNLTTEWKDYALAPSAFVPWQPPKGRGGPGDGLHVEKARRFAVGLAFSHTDFVRGPQEYWIGNLGTAPAPFGVSPEAIKLPHIDGLCPDYQFFPIHGPVKLKTPDGQAIVSPSEINAPADLISLQPRPGGAGFDKHRPWRWQPLLEAWSGNGDHRGTIAALIVSLDHEPCGAVASFTPASVEFYAQPAVQKLLAETARAMLRGVFLAEGGSRFYTQFADEPVVFGSRLARLKDANPGIATVRQSLSGKPVASEAKITDWPAEGFVVTTELLDEAGQAIDRLSHPLHAYEPKPNPHFIQSRDGGFFLDGKPWKVNGVNYMPSSGIGMSLEHSDLFEHWIGAAAYDPEIIQRDLERVKKMNLNVVSAFIYHQSLAAGNLLDFLRRCEALGLKVNLSLRPGTPMDFEWEKIREMIEKSKLAQCDTIFAYDLAWEPSHEDAEYQQKHYRKRWDAWCLKKFGETREMPDGKQWSTDGSHRDRVIAYRQFCDELLAENYGKARDLVRSIDPNHAVSFRMTVTGDPTCNESGRLPFDFYGLKAAVDIWEPEAYGRIGDWQRVRDGRFTTAYAKLCNPNLPLMWAEVGFSVLDRAASQPGEQKLAFQAQYARDFYRLVNESSDDGLVWWWYPGGYRTNEQSDFGIINPDGTDRPITKVIREAGAKFLASEKKAVKPTVFIPISRDKDARGLFGIYEANKQSFWNAIETGEKPELKWEE